MEVIQVLASTILQNRSSYDSTAWHIAQQVPLPRDPGGLPSRRLHPIILQDEFYRLIRTNLE